MTTHKPEPLRLPRFELGDLESTYRTMGSNRALLRAKAESAVREWRWATDVMFELEPLWKERHQLAMGRWLKQPPLKKADRYEYGLDDEGCVRMERQHVRFAAYPERLWCYETFYFYNRDDVERYRYSYHPEADAISFSRYHLAGRRVVLAQTRAQRGVSLERYVWRGASVTEVHTEHAPVDPDGTYAEPMHAASYTTSYGADGSLDELLSHRLDSLRDGAQATLVYKRQPKGTTWESLLQPLRVALVREVFEGVRRIGVAEPAYCLALAWSPGQVQSLPPGVAIGLTSHRSRWLAGNETPPREMLWNPAEFGTWVHLDSAALAALVQPVNQYCCARSNWSKVGTMLNGVAQSLSLLDWSAALPTTKDFFAYATDLNLVDLDRNIKASCPPATLQRLQTQGLLKAGNGRSR